MKAVKIVLTCVAVMLGLTADTYAKEWRGVVPLRSTRADVERLLGPPHPELNWHPKPLMVIYDVEDERATITYSDGLRCEPGWPYGFNVPADTVISIMVAPQEWKRISDLQLDLSRYERTQGPHVASHIDYEDREEGITYTVFESGEENNGLILTIRYWSAARDRHLRCPTQPTGLPEGRPVADHLARFDQYSDLRLSDERARLDNFAMMLRNSPGDDGYIVVYAGHRARRGEARELADRAKTYIVNQRGIAAERIWAVDGGYRIGGLVELYVLPRGGPVPLISPMIRPSQVEIIEGNRAERRRRQRPRARRRTP